MAEALLEDPKHLLTEDGVHCSDPDCVIPTCINRKLGQLIGNDNYGNQIRSIDTLKGCTGINSVSAKDGMDSAPTEANTEMWWRDLESLGLLEQPPPGDTRIDFPFQEVTAVKDEWSGLHDQILPTLQPCMSQWIELGKNQPPSQPFGLFHCWAEEGHSPSPVLQSQLVSILPSQDTQKMAINPARISNNSPAPRRTRSNANRGKFRIQEAGTVVKRQVNSGMAGKRANGCDVIKSQQCGLKCTRKLFGILSLIFQAFDSPHIAELEEYYESVLQKALIEIQAIKI